MEDYFYESIILKTSIQSKQQISNKKKKKEKEEIKVKKKNWIPKPVVLIV